MINVRVHAWMPSRVSHVYFIEGSRRLKSFMGLKRMKLETGSGMVTGEYLGAGGKWGPSGAFHPSHEQIFPTSLAC